MNKQTIKQSLRIVTSGVMLAVLCTTLSPPKIFADGFSPMMEVYIQKGSAGTPVLVHTYTQEEMEALSNTEPQYYTGIDSMPADVQGKGIGVPLNTLIYDLQGYNPGISFNPGGNLVIYATDTYKKDGTHYPYATIPYEYLFNEPRYYFPHLQVYQNSNNKDMSDAEIIEPMICTESIQGRNLTRDELDSGEMDTYYSYRLCFGILPSEVEGTNPPAYISTANKFVYWINRIDVVVPVFDITIDNRITGGTITTDTTGAAAGDVITITIDPDDGNQLVDGTLVACFEDGTTVPLFPNLYNNFTFVMQSYDVMLTASFETIPLLTNEATFISNGVTYTTQTAETNSPIHAPSPPVRNGYTFTGWYFDQSLTNAVSFPYVITTDTTFYAGWIQENNTISNSEDYFTVTIDGTYNDNINVVTDTENGRAAADSTVTVSIALPEYIHKAVTAIKVISASDIEIPITEVVAGQTYTFIMPREDVRIQAEFDENTEDIPSTETLPASLDDTPEVNEPREDNIQGHIPDPAEITLTETPPISSTSPELSQTSTPTVFLAAPLSMTFDLSERMGTRGELKADYSREVLAGDNTGWKVKLAIVKDTVIQKDDSPVSIINVTPIDPEHMNNTAGDIIKAFRFEPDGSIFSEPVSVSLYYDPSELPEGVLEESLTIAYYDSVSQKWQKLDSETDTVNHIISARMTHFSIYAVVSSRNSHLNWWLYGMAAMVVLGTLSFLLYSRYKNARLAAFWNVDENVE